ncbi:MAG TPA: hypothetical protein VF610_10080 [Segetibacter sp.]
MRTIAPCRRIIFLLALTASAFNLISLDNATVARHTKTNTGKRINDWSQGKELKLIESFDKYFLFRL